MTSELFLNWFTKSFVPHVKGDTPSLLIFDGHSSHVTADLITAAQANGITILKLPAHTSHILQPLDVACFRGLKAKWDQKLTSWQRLHVGVRPGKAEFAKLLGNVWVDLTGCNMISGFKATGIYDATVPGNVKVNRYAVPQKLFDEKDLEVYNRKKATGHSQSSQEVSTTPLNVQEKTHDEPKPSTSGYVEKAPDPRPSTSNFQEAPEDQPNTSCVVATPKEPGSVTLSTPAQPSFENLLLASVKNQRANVIAKRRKVASGAEVLTRNEVENIVVSLSAPKNKVKKARKRISTPPVSDDEAEQEIVKSSAPKTKRKKSRKRIPSSSSSSDEPQGDMVLDDSTDSPSESELEGEESGRTAKPSAVGDFVLVRFATKRLVRHYVGQIIEEIEGDEYSVKYMRCQSIQKGKFVWPEKDDISTVEADNDIMMTLPTPTVDRREIVTFSIDLSNFNIV